MNPATFHRPDTALSPRRTRAMAPAAPRLILHIDRLVLHGSTLAQGDRARIEQAFQGEVRRLVDTGDMDVGSLGAQVLDRLRLDDLHVGSDARPDQLGRRLAQALLQGVIP